MTDKKDRKIKFNINTLSVRMLLVIVAAALLFAFAWLASRAAIFSWIEKDYNSAESKEYRYNNYIENLQTYVSKNEISSEDTNAIYNWMRDNRNVYLFIYKDGQLFFDGSADFDETKPPFEKPGDGGESDETSDKDESEDVPGEEDGSISGGSDENPDDEAAGDEAVKDGEESGSSNGAAAGGSSGGIGSSIPGGITGGITMNYPTREEILADAEKNGLLPIEFSDGGTLLVSLVDSTEYFYYNMASIASIVFGVLIFVLVLMLYFTRVTGKITRLAKDVQAVYESDMNSGIRTESGNDELAVLTRNVEQMRATMLESLGKEKEALEANSELITAMSHDIRTPLTVLLGYIDVMKEAPEGSDIKEYLHASEITALRLKELSDDMFKYFLVSGKGVEAEVLAYDAKTLAEQLISEHVLLMMEKNYKVTNENKIKQGTLVKADAQGLMRVVDNAFSNIYKYADKEKPVTVISEETKNGVFIIFENYISEKASRSESNKVGLRSSEKLCKAMGASLKYEEKKIRSDKIFALKIELPIEEK